LRYVPFTSYRFLQTLPLPATPSPKAPTFGAIRIVFPLIGVTPVSCNGPGLPATLGKQQKTP
jgi:hypothetical protein